MSPNFELFHLEYFSLYQLENMLEGTALKTAPGEMICTLETRYILLVLQSHALSRCCRRPEADTMQVEHSQVVLLSTPVDLLALCTIRKPQ